MWSCLSMNTLHIHKSTSSSINYVIAIENEKHHVEKTYFITIIFFRKDDRQKFNEKIFRFLESTC